MEGEFPVFRIIQISDYFFAKLPSLKDKSLRRRTRHPFSLVSPPTTELNRKTEGVPKDVEDTVWVNTSRFKLLIWKG